jgi:hypothetical protein
MKIEAWIKIWHVINIRTLVIILSVRPIKWSQRNPVCCGNICSPPSTKIKNRTCQKCNGCHLSQLSRIPYLWNFILSGLWRHLRDAGSNWTLMNLSQCLTVTVWLSQITLKWVSTKPHWYLRTFCLVIIGM